MSILSFSASAMDLWKFHHYIAGHTLIAIFDYQSNVYSKIRKKIFYTTAATVK